MLLWQPRSLPRLSLEKCRQRWPVLLLVGTVLKQAAQVGTNSRRVFSLDRSLLQFLRIRHLTSALLV